MKPFPARKPEVAMTKGTGANPRTSNATPTQSKDSKEAFLKKINLCSQLLDFNDEKKNVAEKEERLQCLNDLQEMISNQNLMQSLILPNLELVIAMVKRNLFRPLPIVKKQGVSGENGANDDDEVIVDPSWPHLQPVYDFFLQLIINDTIDMRSLKVHITHKFIQEFLELFDSEEPKEREYLKNILHRLYAKLVPRRKMIRKTMTDIFYTLIHETYRFNGTSELLDILAAVISGFAVPLREEHVHFFKNVIISLHKVQTCHKFHIELLRCSMLFLSKDPNLSIPLIEGLLKYWPFANYAKETLFLSELVDILEVSCDMNQLERLAPKIFKRLVKCIASPHLQVSDRAMCFFENDFFLNIIKYFKHISFPILVPIIQDLSQNHWHKLILESLTALRNIIRDSDPVLFEKYAKDKSSPFLFLVKNPQQVSESRKEAEARWTSLETQVKEQVAGFVTPKIPYADDHIVGEFNGVNNGSVLYVD